MSSRRSKSDEHDGRRTTMRRMRTAGTRRRACGAPSVEMYGSDRQCLETVRGLVRAGWTVTVVCPSFRGRTFGGRRGASRRIRDVSVSAPVLRKAALRPANLVRLVAGCLLRCLGSCGSCGTVDPDVVYVSTLTTPVWIVAGRLARRRTVVHVHEAEDALPAVLRAALAAPLLFATRSSPTARRRRPHSGGAFPPPAARRRGPQRRPRPQVRDRTPREELHAPVRLVVVGGSRHAKESWSRWTPSPSSGVGGVDARPRAGRGRVRRVRVVRRGAARPHRVGRAR